MSTTPTVRTPTALSVSMDPKYVDPPLGRSVTTAEMAMDELNLGHYDRASGAAAVAAAWAEIACAVRPI